MSKELKVKVFIEWFNYEGKVQCKDLIAAFNSENWAKHFVETVNIDDRFSRLIIEKVEK